MKKEDKKITKKMMIAEVLDMYPELGDVLIEEYGFGCVSCAGASFETLEEGAMVHGMGEEDIKVMIENLNELAENVSEL